MSSWLLVDLAGKRWQVDEEDVDEEEDVEDVLVVDEQLELLWSLRESLGLADDDGLSPALALLPLGLIISIAIISILVRFSSKSSGSARAALL